MKIKVEAMKDGKPRKVQMCGCGDDVLVMAVSSMQKPMFEAKCDCGLRIVANVKDLRGKFNCKPGQKCCFADVPLERPDGSVEHSH